MLEEARQAEGAAAYAAAAEARELQALLDQVNQQLGQEGCVPSFSFSHAHVISVCACHTWSKAIQRHTVRKSGAQSLDRTQERVKLV